MKKQVFDHAFKQMAVALSHAKGSVKAAATELGWAFTQERTVGKAPISVI